MKPSLEKQGRENDLKSAYRSLNEFQRRLYEGISAVPGMDLSGLPLIIPSEKGAKDIFSSQIDYCIYPWLFLDVFPGIDREQLDELCVVAQLGAESLIQMDKVIDGHLGPTSEVMLAVVLLGGQYKLAESIRRLAGIIDGKSPFWSRFDELFREYIHTTLEEKAMRSQEIPSLEEMERLGRGKAALSKTITAAMTEISGRRDLLPALDKSQDLFSTGYQLYDDVRDWRWDYENGQVSYLLKRAFKELGIIDEDEISGARSVDSDELGRRLFSTDIIPDTLDLASNYFSLAEEVVMGIGCRRWVSWIRTKRSKVEKLRSDLIDIKDRALIRSA
ncbi:MAG TPA: class 1 isoprenoid biosynthesis enzyme [Methanotrichaceae archaeon]|nr:class 1 isoprenoid biosynthesis enzyme [Methanotrichaceae archaeon]